MPNIIKHVPLILALVVVSGAIIYFESQKTTRPSEADIVTVAPRAVDTTDALADKLTADDAAIKNTGAAPESSAGAAPASSIKAASDMPANSEATAKASMTFLSQAEKAQRFELAKEITTPDGFINTDGKPVTISEFIGKKVVLVDFWTYSCINCQRTQPFLNSWWGKYKDLGLVIIGIHTPEFEFEKDFDNVQNAVTEAGAHYPVVLDNDFSTWRAYRNRFWPRKYLIDIDGYIVYDHIGEGAYVETESKIQELLMERLAVLNIKNGDGLGKSDAIAGLATVSTVAAETTNFSSTPEIYFGTARNKDFLGNADGGENGMQTLTLPANGAVTPNLLYLSGRWSFANEYAESKSDEAKIVIKYKAKNVFFVASADDEMSVKIKRDGQPLGANTAGGDVEMIANESLVKIKESRLYKLIEDTQPGEHTLEITIPKPGLKAFTFTFG